MSSESEGVSPTIEFFATWLLDRDLTDFFTLLDEDRALEVEGVWEV